MSVLSELSSRRVSLIASAISRPMGIVSLVGIAVLVYLGLVLTPDDQIQGELVRLIYIHPAMASATYLAFGICALASALYLFPRTRNSLWDQLAAASAEVGVVFCGLTLLTGSIWGRPTWGVWWTWDARLTSTAILFTLFLGYLALRRLPADAEVKAKRTAIAALLAALNVPVVHYSVEWWRTLHQGRTLLFPEPTIHGIQLVTMLLSFVVFTLVLVWLTIQRFRLDQMESEYESQAIDIALEERRSEATTYAHESQRVEVQP